MVIYICHFVLFILAIMLSVLLRLTDSDYPFGNFKLFLYQYVFFLYSVDVYVVVHYVKIYSHC